VAGGEVVRAFVPLPPSPSLDLAALQQPLERALLAVGRLDALSALPIMGLRRLAGTTRSRCPVSGSGP